MSEYNGWRNYSTWNCALHLGQEPYYHAVVEFMKDYKGAEPYKDFCVESGLDEQRNPDLIKWISSKLDYKALNSLMLESAPETSPCTRCESKVDPDTLVPYGDWRLCEDCAGEM